MAAAVKQVVAKDVTTAAEFEAELQQSWREGGICVVDVYSTVWGPCRAIAPTFRRLLLEADEGLRLRFLSADATAILKDLADAAAAAASAPLRAAAPAASPAPARRPVVGSDAGETLPAFWTPILQELEGRARPAFLYWRDGKLARRVDGVHTPALVEAVRSLCAVRAPADDVITNPLVLEQWLTHFGREESEVLWPRFLSALSAICQLTAPLDAAETQTLRAALRVDRANSVTAQAVQDFVGAELTLLQAFTRTLPGYEERAVQARLRAEVGATQMQERVGSAPRDRAAQAAAAAAAAAAGDAAAPAAGITVWGTGVCVSVLFAGVVDAAAFRDDYVGRLAAAVSGVATAMAPFERVARGAWGAGLHIHFPSAADAEAALGSAIPGATAFFTPQEPSVVVERAVGGTDGQAAACGPSPARVAVRVASQGDVAGVAAALRGAVGCSRVDAYAAVQPPEADEAAALPYVGAVYAHFASVDAAMAAAGEAAPSLPRAAIVSVDIPLPLSAAAAASLAGASAAPAPAPAAPAE